MKVRILAIMVLFTTCIMRMNAQQHSCAAHEEYERMLKEDAAFAKNQEALEKYTEEYVSWFLKQNPEVQKSVIKVIPVVFHIIHQGGNDNISRAQMLDQIALMNDMFQKKNADTSQVPSVFKPLIGDAQLEFRMATLDPNGNCTDGVTRTYNNMTNDARNNVKSIIYWPSNKYLNIWVVKSILNSGGSPGTVLAFSQFPGGAASTDGIVCRHDFLGSIGTALNNGNSGRTMVHETGHWFNLRHIWGDAVCGNDLVGDTPTQQALNFGCPTFPHVTNCTGNSPNGDMFMNYMDYSDGTCQHMFSVGQCTRMNAALGSSVSGRNNLWTAANLAATGTDGNPPCAPQPIAVIAKDFYSTCAGGNITFMESSYNGDPFTYNWTFSGGNPSTSTAQKPTINFPTAGTYDVTLTVTNANGSNTTTKTGIVHVYPAAATNTIPVSEGFETITFPGSDWYEFSDISQHFIQTSLAAATGTQSVYLQNTTSSVPGTDEIISPSYNFSNVTSPTFNFKVAFAQRNAAAINELTVYISTNCGVSWTPRWTKTGAALSTITGTNAGTFIPTAAQWRQETVNINPAIGKNSVMFKFQFTNTGEANNLFIDDINIGGVTALVENIGSATQVSLQPNPTNEGSQINFVLSRNDKVTITLYDAIGKQIEQAVNQDLFAGSHAYYVGKQLTAGVYFIEMKVGTQRQTLRLIKQ